MQHEEPVQQGWLGWRRQGRGCEEGRERYQDGGKGQERAPFLMAGVGLGGASSALERGCAGKKQRSMQHIQAAFPKAARRAIVRVLTSYLQTRCPLLASRAGIFSGLGEAEFGEQREKNGVGMGGGEGRGEERHERRE